MKKKPEDKNDLEECKRKIDELLKEYNCIIESDSIYSGVYLTDKDNESSIVL